MREWERLGAQLAELSPAKYDEVLAGLRMIRQCGRKVTLDDWNMLLTGSEGARKHG